jgi:hypothetical protein
MLARGSGDVIERRVLARCKAAKDPTVEETLTADELGSAVHSAPILGKTQ